MKDRLIIIGAKGHGKVAADIALKMRKWESIAFLDDDETIGISMGLKVIGKSSEIYKYIKDSDIFIGVGSNVIRKRLLEQLEEMGASIPILVHPSAVIGEQVELEAGTVIMAGAVINCCTKIGKGCIVNTCASIDHDNILEDYVHISPGANLAGTVIVGEASWLGIGSKVTNNVRIASGCKIGAGAVVIRDITETGTYVGVPVRRV